MAAIGSVWAAGSWLDDTWAVGSWADAVIVVITGGQVWVFVNGVSTPPAQQAVGTEAHWIWIDGTVQVPPAPKRSPWPPRYSRSRRS